MANRRASVAKQETTRKGSIPPGVEPFLVVSRYSKLLLYIWKYQLFGCVRAVDGALLGQFSMAILAVWASVCRIIIPWKQPFAPQDSVLVVERGVVGAVQRLLQVPPILESCEECQTIEGALRGLFGLSRRHPFPHTAERLRSQMDATLLQLLRYSLKIGRLFAACSGTMAPLGDKFFNLSFHYSILITTAKLHQIADTAK